MENLLPVRMCSQLELDLPDELLHSLVAMQPGEHKGLDAKLLDSKGLHCTADVLADKYDGHTSITIIGSGDILMGDEPKWTCFMISVSAQVTARKFKEEAHDSDECPEMEALAGVDDIVAPNQLNTNDTVTKAKANDSSERLGVSIEKVTDSSTPVESDSTNAIIAPLRKSRRTPKEKKMTEMIYFHKPKSRKIKDEPSESNQTETCSFTDPKANATSVSRPSKEITRKTIQSPEKSMVLASKMKQSKMHPCDEVDLPVCTSSLKKNNSRQLSEKSQIAAPVPKLKTLQVVVTRSKDIARMLKSNSKVVKTEVTSDTKPAFFTKEENPEQQDVPEKREGSVCENQESSIHLSRKKTKVKDSNKRSMQSMPVSTPDERITQKKETSVQEICSEASEQLQRSPCIVTAEPELQEPSIDEGAETSAVMEPIDTSDMEYLTEKSFGADRIITEKVKGKRQKSRNENNLGAKPKVKRVKQVKDDKNYTTNPDKQQKSSALGWTLTPDVDLDWLLDEYLSTIKPTKVKKETQNNMSDLDKDQSTITSNDAKGFDIPEVKIDTPDPVAENVFRCLLCAGLYVTHKESSFMKHYNTMHMITYKSQEQVLTLNDRECQKSALKILVEESTQNKMASGMYCIVCFTGIRNPKSLVSHMKSVHRDLPDLDEHLQKVDNILHVIRTVEEKSRKERIRFRQEDVSSQDEKRQSDDENKQEGAYDYQCLLCQKIFANFALMRQHVRIVHHMLLEAYSSILNNPDEHAEEQQKMQADKAARLVERGRRKASKGESLFHYTCPVCSVVVACSAFERHLTDHNTEIDHELLNAMVGQMSQALSETRPCLALQKVKVMCPYCHLQEEGASIFKHMEALHGEEADYAATLHTVKDTHRQMLNVETNKINKLRAELGLRYVCKFCGKSFTYSTARTRHEVHECESNPQSRNLVVGRIECKECGKKFKSNVTFKGHMAGHNNAPIVCWVCGRSFRLKNTLNHHVRREHKKVVHHTCDICGKSFYEKCHWRAHMRIHKEVQDFMFMCVECGKQFKNKDVAKRHHKEVHMGQRALSCAVCGYSTNRPSTMARHKCHVMVKVDGPTQSRAAVELDPNSETAQEIKSILMKHDAVNSGEAIIEIKTEPGKVQTDMKYEFVPQTSVSMAVETVPVTMSDAEIESVAMNQTSVEIDAEMESVDMNQTSVEIEGTVQYESVTGGQTVEYHTYPADQSTVELQSIPTIVEMESLPVSETIAQSIPVTEAIELESVPMDDSSAVEVFSIPLSDNTVQYVTLPTGQSFQFIQ